MKIQHVLHNHLASGSSAQRFIAGLPVVCDKLSGCASGFLLLLFIVVYSSAINAQDLSQTALPHDARTLVNNLRAYPGDPSYDIAYYKLDLNINYDQSMISGATTVGATAARDGLVSCYYDLASVLTTDSVLCNGIRLAFAHLHDTLHVDLNKSYAKGERFDVIVYYHGNPASTGFGSFTFGTHNEVPAVYTLSEPYGAKDWFPCKDTPGDKADSADVIITAVNSFKVVSNGSLISEEELPGNMRRTHWHVSYPISHYLLMIAMTNYRVYNLYWKYTATDSMLVTNYIYPETFDVAKPAIDQTPAMLTLFSNLFGMYPFVREKYGHAQFGWSGGMEHQTCTSLGRFTEDLIAHELAHQWFGDRVTCKDWRNIWLNEGFATYGQAIYYEAKNGAKGLESFIAAQMINAKQASGSLYLSDISGTASIFNYNRSYAKGCIVLHMLRNVVGDSTFFAILRAYLVKPELSYNVATTEDFKSVAEAIAGIPLKYFFDEWIYGSGYPIYSPTVNSFRTGQGAYQTDIILSQLQKTGTFFTMPVDLKFSDGTQDTVIRVMNNQNDQAFSFLLNFKPGALYIDLANKILRDVTTSVFPGEFEHQPDYVLQQNYPNPFNPATTIIFTAQKAGNVRVNLYSASGELIAGLYSGYTSRGPHVIHWDARNYASGVYFYSLEAEGQRVTKSLVVLK